MNIGILNPSFFNFCQRIFEQVISLAQSIKSEKEIEFSIIERCLARLSTAYVSKVLDKEIAKEQFFPKEEYKDIEHEKRTALGEFLRIYTLSDTEGPERKKLLNAKERLRRIRGGQGETEQNTEHPEDNNSSNQGQQNNNEDTESSESNNSSPTVQELAEKRVKEAVEVANSALVGNSIENLKKARQELIEIKFESNNKKLQVEFARKEGQKLLDKLDEREK